MTWSTLEKLHLDCLGRRERLTQSRRNARLALFGVAAAFAAVIAVTIGLHP